MVTINNNIFVEEFGQEVTFYILNSTGGYDPLIVNAIFDNAFFDASIGEIILESSTPRLTCVESGVASVKKGDYVTVDSINYDVFSKQPDGTGMVTIILAKKKQ